jgi:uncharacterized protein YjbJ (UPF0337 family)
MRVGPVWGRVEDGALTRALFRRTEFVMSDLSNKAQDVTGKVKEKVGDVTGNDELKGEGQGDQVESKAKQVADDAKDAAKGAVDKVKGLLHRG